MIATLLGGRLELDVPETWVRTDTPHLVGWVQPAGAGLRTTVAALLELSGETPVAQLGEVLLEESAGWRLLGLATPPGEALLLQRRLPLAEGVLVLSGTALASRWPLDGPALRAVLTSLREVPDAAAA